MHHYLIGYSIEEGEGGWRDKSEKRGGDWESAWSAGKISGNVHEVFEEVKREKKSSRIHSEDNYVFLAYFLFFGKYIEQMEISNDSFVSILNLFSYIKSPHLIMASPRREFKPKKPSFMFLYFRGNSSSSGFFIMWIPSIVWTALFFLGGQLRKHRNY